MQSITKYLWLLFNLSVAQIIPFDHPLPILTSPVLQVAAGRYLHYQ